MIDSALTNPIALAAFLGSLAFLVGLINGVLRLVDRLKEKPPPSLTYMTKEDCQSLHRGEAERYKKVEAQIEAINGERGQVAAQIEALRREIKADMQAITSGNEVRAIKVHERINEVLAEVSELRGELRGRTANPLPAAAPSVPHPPGYYPPYEHSGT